MKGVPKPLTGKENVFQVASSEKVQRSIKRSELETWLLPNRQMGSGTGCRQHLSQPVFPVRGEPLYVPHSHLLPVYSCYTEVLTLEHSLHGIGLVYRKFFWWPKARLQIQSLKVALYASFSPICLNLRRLWSN